MMTTLKTVVNGFVSAREYDNATLGRLQFWVDELGEIELADITEEQVDAALVRLAERGKLRAGRNTPTTRLGQPLAGSTLNRYVGQLAQVYKYARRLRLLRRTHVPPTRGVEKAEEATHHDRYFTDAEVDRLVNTARVVDQRWGKLPALILLAYTTGLRKTNLLELRWCDVDIDREEISVSLTKNGDPMVQALVPSTAAELRRLPRGGEYVFGNAKGKPFDIRRLWVRVLAETGITGRTFHSLRHACGHKLAKSGASQAMIMKYMGHRSLTASARYMHVGIEDKRRVAHEVFG